MTERRKITFDLTLGSYWEDGKDWPQGGEFQQVTIFFDLEEGEKPFEAAVEALRKWLGRSDFHIWYWWWHTKEIEEHGSIGLIGSCDKLGI